MHQPISASEFRAFFKRCTPPIGWPEKLAVANSGGPDSTCLLFLLKRLVQERRVDEYPRAIVSLTVDHGLQDTSSEMAHHSSTVAVSLEVEHVTTAIPWSEHPFPSKPTRSFEKIARDARYHLLFHAMSKTGSKVIAFGHHADDQIETALLRLSKGSTEFGAAGMRRCRRWGMGFNDGEGALGWAGIEGMRRWIVRPLLAAPKSRILATCHENGLEYVTDPTNFQPEITTRNAIRHLLNKTIENDNIVGPSSRIGSRNLLSNEVPPREEQSSTERPVILDFRLPPRFSFDISAGKAHLLNTMDSLSEQRRLVDDTVTQCLEKCRRESPPSTVLLASSPLHVITDPTIRRSTVLRILRYVSFYPWGSLPAEAHRRSESLNQIVDKLWSSTSEPKAFVAGGGVIWIPGYFIEDSRFKMFQHKNSLKTLQSPGNHRPTAWMASRQHPFQKSISSNDVNVKKDPLRLDITQLTSPLAAASDAQEEAELLWDNRFRLRINVANFSEAVRRAQSLRGIEEGNVFVEPETRWYLPRIVWRGSSDSVLLARTTWANADKRRSTTSVVDQDHFLSIEEARTLDAL